MYKCDADNNGHTSTSNTVHKHIIIAISISTPHEEFWLDNSRDNYNQLILLTDFNVQFRVQVTLEQRSILLFGIRLPNPNVILFSISPTLPRYLILLFVRFLLLRLIIMSNNNIP